MRVPNVEFVERVIAGLRKTRWSAGQCDHKQQKGFPHGGSTLLAKVSLKKRADTTINNSNKPQFPISHQLFVLVSFKVRPASQKKPDWLEARFFTSLEWRFAKCLFQ